MVDTKSRVKLLYGYKKGKHGQAYYVTAHEFVQFARFVEQNFEPGDRLKFDFAFNAKKFSQKQPDFYLLARHIYADFDQERKSYHNYKVNFEPSDTSQQKSEKLPF